MFTLAIKRNDDILAHISSDGQWIVLDPSPVPGAILIQLYKGTGNDCNLPATIVGRVGDWLIVDFCGSPEIFYWNSLVSDPMDSVWITPELPALAQFKLNPTRSQTQEPTKRPC